VKIKIDQALCGEKDKAWDLLRTTMQSTDVASKIAYKSGPPDQPPAGVTWAPFIRAFAYREFFILAKIFLDNSKTVRPGRGFSHALILGSGLLDQVKALDHLLLLLPNEINKEAELEIIEVETTDSSEDPILLEAFQTRFNKVIKALGELEDRKGTIVWVGQEDYELAVQVLWRLLSQEEKQVINIGLYFNPSELDQSKLNFIATLEITETKFLHSASAVVRKGDQITLDSLGDKIIAGEQGAKVRFARFVDELENQSFTRSDVQKIAKVIATFESLEKIADLRKLNTLSSIVAEYAPLEREAQKLKQSILKRFEQLKDAIAPDELALLRHFKIKSFQTSETILKGIVSHWLENVLFSLKKNGERDYGALIVAFYQGDANNWLTKYFKAQMKLFLGDVKDSTVKLIVQWSSNNGLLFGLIQNDIADGPEVERVFTRNINLKLSVAVFDDLRLFCRNRGWLLSYAVLMKNHHSVIDALQEQIVVDRLPNHFGGIEIILEGLSEDELISSALTVNDERLIKLAGKVCHDRPDHLKRIDIKDLAWQGIWLTAVELGNNIDTGLNKAESTVSHFLDLVSEEEKYEVRLLEIISRTAYSNLLGYSNREKFWTKVPLHLRKVFLTSTATELLSTLSRDSTFRIPADKVLSNFIVKEDFISTFLYYNKSNFRIALPVFKAFKLPEESLRRYISNYEGQLDFDIAAELASHVNSRKFDDAAGAIYEKAKRHQDFVAVIPDIQDLLNPLRQMKAFFKGWSVAKEVPETKWWKAFSSLVVELLPRGPFENEIWVHAGGNAAKLKSNGTGEELWHHALGLIKNKKKGAPNLSNFISELKREFHNNDSLKILVTYREGHY
jgi:hypothetical protein